MYESFNLRLQQTYLSIKYIDIFGRFLIFLYTKAKKKEK